ARGAAPCRPRAGTGPRVPARCDRSSAPGGFAIRRCCRRAPTLALLLTISRALEPVAKILETEYQHHPGHRGRDAKGNARVAHQGLIPSRREQLAPRRESAARGHHTP